MFGQCRFYFYTKSLHKTTTTVKQNCVPLQKGPRLEVNAMGVYQIVSPVVSSRIPVIGRR